MDAEKVLAAFDCLTAEEQRELFTKVGQASAYLAPETDYVVVIYNFINEMKRGEN